MNKEKLKRLREWAEGERDRHQLASSFRPPLYGLVELIDILDDDPEPKPEPVKIAPRACEVCGWACGVAYCDVCKRLAEEFRRDIYHALNIHLSGEFELNPDFDGFEFAYNAAKNGYLRRIEKRKERKQ